MVSELLIQRLVDIPDDAAIDNLVHGNVVNVRNSYGHVFDRREGETMYFYTPDVFKRDVVTEIEIPRSSVVEAGNRLHFYDRGRVDRDLLAADGEYYQERRKDLVALGLMAEEPKQGE